MSDKIKIGYRVIAVRERQKLVENLVSRLGETEEIVFWDEERKGCLWNALRAWKDYKNAEPDVTHWCVLADDAMVVNNFKEIMNIFASNFPDVIITSGLNRQMTYKDRAKHTPYIRLKNHTAQGLMICSPVALIDGYIDFYDRWFNNEEWAKWQNDDAMWRMYAFLNKHPVMTSIPELVGEEQVPSVMAGHKMFANSDIWQGFDVDIEQFKTDEYIVSKGFTMNMHMDRRNHPLKDMISKELKRRRTVEKLIERSKRV